MSPTQVQAAIRIARKLSLILNVYVEPSGLKLYPAKGFWTHLHQDVMRFEGVFPQPQLPTISYTLGSWNLTISEIAKGCRFEIYDGRKDHRKLQDFDIVRKIL